jgi:PGF-CTERM protein
MNVDRNSILSLALTAILVTSVLPMGIVGMSGTAQADSHGNWYTLRQPDANVCYEVQSFTVSHEKMEPEVDVRGSNDVGDVTGPYRDPDWDGFVTIESIMDYRYRHYPDGTEPAVGQTPYYAPYLNDQYRAEGWEFGTYGLYNWSDDNHSQMFFYENARGEVSLVVRHDKLWENTGTSSHDPYNGVWPGGSDGFFERSPGGGEVSWDMYNLPSGSWRYMDDMYPVRMDDYYTDASGVRYGHRDAEYESRPLREFSGGDFFVDWTWGAGNNTHGTDGGAYRGFQNVANSGPVTIEPEFVDGIERWEVRHNNASAGLDGEKLELDMDSELVIQQGRRCPDASLSMSPSERSPEAGENVTFTASTDESVTSYRWDFDGDGETDDETATATITHSFDGTGEREVSVTVETPDGIRDSDSMTVEPVPNEDPTARVNVDPGDRGLDDYHVVGEQIVLNASASTDNSGAITEYDWEYGDGANGTNAAQVPYSYDEPGEYEVSVTVTDAVGNTDTATYTVEIVEPDGEDPTARGEVEPTEVEAGAPLTLDGSDSDDNRGILAYQWDYDSDGSYDAATSNATLSPQSEPYGSAGTYNATLRVVDGNGNTANETIPVTVTEPEPPEIGEVSVQDDVSAGEEFEVSAAAEDESGIASVTYSFSDGTTETVEPGESVTHTFESPGTAAVAVVVRDRAGYENSTGSITVNVTQEPAADLSLTTDGTEPNGTEIGDTVTFDASESTDVDGPIVEYQWDFDGDGAVDETTNASRLAVTHEYDSGGTYDAAVTVVDQNNLTDTATAQIEIEADEDALDDGDDGDGGGSVNFGPPPVVEETERTGPNSATIDVQNARGDETIRAGLPATDVGNETGVAFEGVAVDLAGDDPHVAFDTAASTDPPEGVPELSETTETLAYFDLDGRYLGTGVENATVEFTVTESGLGGLTDADEVVIYQYDDGWTRVDATVTETGGDAYRLTATADDLGTLAVATDRSLSVTDAGLENGAVVAGDTMTATATVSNDAATAETGTVELELDGSVVASETVEVPAGETVEVTVRGTAPATGTYEATVSGVSLGELDVREPRPADVSVADVSVNESTITAGEQVAITATVENTGDEIGEETVALTLFGEELETQTVEVDGGETADVTFVRQIDAPGTYAPSVGGESAEVEVTAADDGDLGDSAPDVPGFGVGAALVALLAATLLARLRD